MARELTEAERDAGYSRVDDETNLPLRKNWMSQAEGRAFLARMRASWQRKLMSREPPKEGDWAWSDLHGWVRRNESKIPAKKR
jgi:hypothetical protein